MVSDSRGQLLLTAAVLIALVIVASAVLLNGLVTPETATTSSLSTDAIDLDRSAGSMQTDLGQLFGHATSVDDVGVALPYADDDDLGASVNETYRPLVLKESANRTGAVVDVRYARARSLDGDVVFNQTDSEFGNGTHDDWQIAYDVETLPRASFVVNREHANSEPDAFRVVVDGDSGGQWTFAVTRNGVHVDGGPERCGGAIDPAPDEQIRLDVQKPAVHNASLVVTGADGDVTCSRTLDVGEGLAKPWNVSIENGHEAEGTYAVSFEGTPHADAVGPTGGPWPDHRTGVINPAFDVTYLTEGITYESSYRLYNATR